MKKSVKYIIIYVILSILSIYLAGLGLILKLKSALDISLSSIHLTNIGLTLLTFWLNGPLYFFGLIYLEITNLLIVWCENIQTHNWNNDLLKNTKVFIYALHKASENFSSFLFWIIPLNFCLIVIVGYWVIIHFLTLFHLTIFHDSISDLGNYSHKLCHLFWQILKTPFVSKSSPQ